MPTTVGLADWHPTLCEIGPGFHSEWWHITTVLLFERKSINLPLRKDRSRQNKKDIEENELELSFYLIIQPRRILHRSMHLPEVVKSIELGKKIHKKENQQQNKRNLH